MKAILRKEDNYDQNIKILQELATITVKPIEIIEFTNEYEPILFPGADMSQGISSVIKTASDTGIRVLETGTTVVKDVIGQGLNVISGPIKIIIITASIVGRIILPLIAYKYIHKNKQEKSEINLTTHTQVHPHMWKHHDVYYKEIIPTN